MTLRDRMQRADPISKATITILDDLITAVNQLQNIVFSGQNPHNESDTTNLITSGNAGGADDVIDLSQELITDYEAHIGSATFHIGAVSTNEVTEVGVPIEIYTLINELKSEFNNHISNDAISAAGEALVYLLVNELKADLNAHMDDGTAHTNNDDVTDQVAEDDATSKASAITLVNEVRASYEAHRVNLEDVGTSAVHGLADTTNVVAAVALVPATATWEQIIILLNEIKVDYNAHIPLTTGTVHANADVTNGASETSASGLSHTNDDDVTDPVVTATATTKVLAIAMANEIKTSYEAHRVNLLDVALNAVHGGADSTNVISVDDLESDATWTEIAEMADALRVGFVAHMALTAGSVHGTADISNPVAANVVGTVTTAVYAGLNELKADYNAHAGEFGSYHAVKDDTDLITAADATTLATSRTLVNQLKLKYNDHISRADQEVTKSITTLDEEVA